MITGHAAVAIAAKARWPRLSIVLLLAAAYFADIAETWLFWVAWPTKNADWSHALIFLAPVAVIVALVYGGLRRDFAGGWVLGAVLVSHWLLDVITWMKPTWPHGPVIGLRLYDHAALDFALETILLIATWRYVRKRAHGLLADARVYATLILIQLVANVAGWRQGEIRRSEGLPAAVPDISAGTSRASPPADGCHPEGAKRPKDLGPLTIAGLL